MHKKGRKIIMAGMGECVLYPQQLLKEDGKDGEWLYLLQRFYSEHLVSMGLHQWELLQVPHQFNKGHKSHISLKLNLMNQLPVEKNLYILGP